MYALREFEKHEAKDYAPVRIGFAAGLGPVYQVHFKAFDGAWYPCTEHGLNDPVNLTKCMARASDFSHDDITQGIGGR